MLRPMRSISNIFAAFASRTIDVHEWDRSVINGSRLLPNSSWSSLTSPKAPLRLTGVSLAHAVVKADFLVAGDYGFSCIGFLLQMDRIINFESRGNMRLIQGASKALSDVAHSSITGRIGQGLAILFAHSQGYTHVSHLSQLPQVKSWLANNPNDPKRQVADFLFEDGSHNRMILESKASFKVSPNDPVQVMSSPHRVVRLVS